MDASLEGSIPGCTRLQICGLFARFCRDLQNYLVDILDVAMGPVQFETRHPPHLLSPRCYPLLPSVHCREDIVQVADVEAVRSGF
jgi:hypothetical protein